MKPGPGHVLYLYGISESPPTEIVQQTGVDGVSAIEPIECDGFACWVSRVSADEFEQRLAQNMENLDWVAEKSVAHQRAISAIARESDLLPTRLATVFRSQDSLLQHVRNQTSTLKRDLARVKGADEWGIKVFAFEPKVICVPKVHTGKDYLKAKAALLPKRGTDGETSTQLAELADALSSVAIESAAPGKISSGQKGLVFQTSLLVKRADRKKLESVLNKFSKQWAPSRRIECTGPWPPYSFVSRVSEHD
jgi:hypothetical protein